MSNRFKKLDSLIHANLEGQQWYEMERQMDADMKEMERQILNNYIEKVIEECKEATSLEPTHLPHTAV